MGQWFAPLDGLGASVMLPERPRPVVSTPM